jgi:hypothetical protein
MPCQPAVDQVPVEFSTGVDIVDGADRRDPYTEGRKATIQIGMIEVGMEQRDPVAAKDRPEKSQDLPVEPPSLQFPQFQDRDSL